MKQLKVEKSLVKKVTPFKIYVLRPISKTSLCIVELVKKISSPRLKCQYALARSWSTSQAHIIRMNNRSHILFIKDKLILRAIQENISNCSQPYCKDLINHNSLNYKTRYIIQSSRINYSILKLMTVSIQKIFQKWTLKSSLNLQKAMLVEKPTVKLIW